MRSAYACIDEVKRVVGCVLLHCVLHTFAVRAGWTACSVLLVCLHGLEHELAVRRAKVHGVPACINLHVMHAGH